MFYQNLLMDNLSPFANEMDDLSSDPQSLDSDTQFRHPKLDDVIDLPSASNASPSTKKRRPIAAEVVRQRIESGQWRRKQMIGSSLRFQFFDELMEGNKSLELIICRLCDSAYSIHSRSHCLEHIKQRHPEVITESLVNSKLEDVEKNDFNEHKGNLTSNSGGNDAHSSMMMNDFNHSQINSPLSGAEQRWQSFNTSGGEDFSSKDLSLDMFNTRPNPIATPLVKRRRLITTEMAKCRLQSGEWQLRSVAGASVRCRFFYEIYEGDSPLNTLSCKLCGATYSTQSRSHYREHVRRRHSEVYCVRSGRVSNNTTFDNPNLQSSNDNALRLPLNLHSQMEGLGGGVGGGDNDEDDKFLLQFQNIPRMGESDSPMNNSLMMDDGLGGFFGSNSSGIGNNGTNSALKMRRIITTETVMNHLEAGDWLRRAIPGMSIRSRFFDEIVEGETALNILICKICGSTYSAQSRSHCVEHVKKRHLSILEGNEEADDFEIEAWRETRKVINPSTSQPQSQAAAPSNKPISKPMFFDKNKLLPAQNSMQQRNKLSPLTNSVSAAQSSANRRRKPGVPVVEPDQTIETPSIDSILQSLASQALFQNNGDGGGVEDDFMEPEDYKFDLSAINNIINGGVTSSSTLNRKRNYIGEDGNALNHTQKRKNAEAALQSLLEPETDPTPASPVGGINDQLFALSNCTGCDETGDESLLDDTTPQLELFGKINSAATDTGNGDERPPSSNSASSRRGNSVMRILRPVSAQQNHNLARPPSTSPSVLSNHNSAGQQLNHQQLLMAARTAVLLSGNTGDSCDARSPSPQIKDQKHNGFLRNNFGANLPTLPLQLSSGSNVSNYRNMYPSHPVHPLSNSSGISSISNSGNFYQTAIQRQQQHELRQRQMFELQQYQQRSMLQQHQQHRAQMHASRQGINLNAQRPMSEIPQFSGLANKNEPVSFSHSTAGAVPPGLLPPSFLNSRVVVVNNAPNALSNHLVGKANSAAPTALIEKPEVFSNEADDLDSESFCKSCKSEFPNVLRGLNELYGRVNDLIDVMHLALGTVCSKEPHNSNIVEALKKLEKTAANGVAAVTSLASSGAARNELSSATSSLDEAPVLEANNIIENDNEVESSEENENDEIEEIEAEVVQSCDEKDEADAKYRECRSVQDEPILNFATISALVPSDNSTKDDEEEEGQEEKSLVDDEVKDEEVEDDEKLAAMVNLGGSFATSIDLTLQQDMNDANDDAVATPSSVITLDDIPLPPERVEDQKVRRQERTLSNNSDANSVSSTGIRDVYLSFLEKEILKVTMDEFDLEKLNNLSNLVQKFRPNKVTAALERLTSRGLIEIASVDKYGVETFKKNAERIDQLNLEQGVFGHS